MVVVVLDTLLVPAYLSFVVDVSGHKFVFDPALNFSPRHEPQHTNANVPLIF